MPPSRSCILVDPQPRKDTARSFSGQTMARSSAGLRCRRSRTRRPSKHGQKTVGRPSLVSAIPVRSCVPEVSPVCSRASPAVPLSTQATTIPSSARRRRIAMADPGREQPHRVLAEKRGSRVRLRARRGAPLHPSAQACAPGTPLSAATRVRRCSSPPRRPRKAHRPAIRVAVCSSLLGRGVNSLLMVG